MSMPEAFAEALGTPGLGWLCLIIFVAGTVRGFAGFGGALIFIPLASIHIPPIWCIVAMMPGEFFGTLPLLPRALRDGDRRHVPLLALGTAIGLPLGVYALRHSDPAIFRWAVAALSLTMVAMLASGWRHARRFSRPELAGIGAASGFFGGFSGIAGPPVILAYVSGPYAPARVRANTLLFFSLLEVLLFITFATQGVLDAQALTVGLILMLPYGLGNQLGAWIFDPARARLYRFVAYGIITGSALVALPVYG
ncbi:sulfite exporter TauE/SafE family protein [Tropicimonas sp. TH_r6]|uniref:sulfite exporter TauE/SafE family protein n=1 Tax=Tropicimonas sp. TH_r6 TaxID=3082085 RepID=UPI002954CD13|nr:sulfite exporter TauE/SafE family protein [Tropicimonas sp. TH_r6]MDV7144937.1 sulfite exporter TauE/SafE family protein [Tropicimonas sp. TH_r6]